MRYILYIAIKIINRYIYLIEEKYIDTIDDSYAALLLGCREISCVQATTRHPFCLPPKNYKNFRVFLIAEAVSKSAFRRAVHVCLQQAKKAG